MLESAGETCTNSYISFFGFCFVAIPSGARGLHSALYLGFTPGCAQGTRQRQRAQVSCLESARSRPRVLCSPCSPVRGNLPSLWWGLCYHFRPHLARHCWCSRFASYWASSFKPDACKAYSPAFAFVPGSCWQLFIGPLRFVSSLSSPPLPSSPHRLCHVWRLHA